MKVSGEVFRMMCWLAVVLTTTAIVRYSINLEGWLFRVLFAAAVLVAGFSTWVWPRVFLGILTLNERIFEYDGIKKTWIAPVLAWIGAGGFVLSIPFAFTNNDEAFAYTAIAAACSGLMIGARELHIKQAKEQ